jgi:hypothetical protein
MIGECAQCHKTGDMKIYDCGLNFCSFDCQKLYRYKPDMTDKTWKPDTTIDLISLDYRTDLILETPDDFYSTVSGYKAIMVKYPGLCKPKQIGSYHSLDEAKADWEKYKKKYNLKSWADSHKKFVVTEVSKGDKE